MAINPHMAAAISPGKRFGEYEQPLSERMRTFMRLEFLYRQLLFNSDNDNRWGTRAALGNLIETMTILMRGDLRSDVHKELDGQIAALEKYKSQPEVDHRRLDALIGNLKASRSDLEVAGTNFLQPLKDNEFLSAIKHRSAIPGGTCEFDLPEYNHWLRQSIGQRRDDLERWIAVIRPVCDAVAELLWLIRESAQPQEQIAVAGMYQQKMKMNLSCRLLRITLADDCSLFPEISGSQHRFTVRFLKWSSVDRRALQVGHDVKFHLSIC